nr:hypothetical protein [Tanacetum cinerariifolium]
MSSNSNDIQAADSDTRPPMLDRIDYDSWSQHTLGTTLEGGVLLRPERSRTYDDFNENEKKRFNADVRATNIVLQGEDINEYYVQFHKLVNDIRNMKMTMPNIQLNSKFVNNKSPEWHRFMTTVKLNKRLKETNHEQLYSYLKQNEKHAAQDRLIIEIITPMTNDQLAFVSSVQPYTQSSPVQSHQYPPSSAPLQPPHVQSLSYSQFIKPSQLEFGYTQADEIPDTLTKQVGNRAAGTGGAHIRAGNVNAGQGKPIKFFNYIDDHPVRYLALNDDNIFQANECDAFNSDQAGPSNASILSEVHDLENAIDPSDSDTRPPMLDRTDYDSWSQRGVLLRPERSRTYDDFNENEKKRFNAGVRATNIVLQGENINEYYVQFHKLVNDIRNMKMTMPNIQLNPKFVNNKSPEWHREIVQLALGEHILELGMSMQANECDAFNSDVNDEPISQSILMANLSSIGPTYQQAGPSNASILSETQLKEKMPCVTSNDATPKVPACVKYAIDVQPIPPRQRNNRVVQHGYLNRLRDTLDTLYEIAEEARSKRLSDNNLDYACVYTKRSQELLENVSASCPKADNKRDTIIATTPVTRKKHVTFSGPLETSGNNPPKIAKQ